MRRAPAQSWTARPQTAWPQTAWPQTAWPQTAWPQTARPQTARPPDGATPDGATPDGAAPDAAARLALATRLESVAARLDALSRGEMPPAAAAPMPASTPGQPAAVEELDRAVSILAERLELGAYEAFVLDG